MSDSPHGIEECVGLGQHEVVCIYPVQLLQFLDNRATLLAEKTAKPGTEPIKTELYRGQRVAVLALKEELTQALAKWQNNTTTV